MLGISIFILYKNNGAITMTKIKKSKLTEILKSYGVSEGFLSKFFGNIKKSKKEKEYEKLTKDPEFEKVLKKYNIKPVDWK